MYPKKVADTPAMRFRRCHPGALEELAKGSVPTRFFWPSGVAVGVGSRWQELVEGIEISKVSCSTPEGDRHGVTPEVHFLYFPSLSFPHLGLIQAQQPISSAESACHRASYVD